MAVSSVSVTSSATQIVAEKKTTPHRTRIIIDNQSSETLYLGEDNTVTTSTGITLASGEKREFGPNVVEPRFIYRGAIWGIVKTGPADIRVWEMFLS